MPMATMVENVKHWLLGAANDWYSWLLKNTDGDAKDHLKDLASMDKSKVWEYRGSVMKTYGGYTTDDIDAAQQALA